MFASCQLLYVTSCQSQLILKSSRSLSGGSSTNSSEILSDYSLKMSIGLQVCCQAHGFRFLAVTKRYRTQDANVQDCILRSYDLQQINHKISSWHRVHVFFSSKKQKKKKLAEWLSLLPLPPNRGKHIKDTFFYNIIPNG